MISLIICSRLRTTGHSLSHNIAMTVGTEYEIVHIDNSDNRHNIFQAYNKGVETAQGDILCFMHEDIRFHTEHWGKVVESVFEDENVAALGVAGGSVVPECADWRFFKSHTYLKQGSTVPGEKPIYYIADDTTNTRNAHLVRVALLDGVWMCFRKSLFERIRFDDRSFHGFHLYDSDICMQANALGVGVYVTGDISIEHFSVGTFTEDFEKDLGTFSKKWSRMLPYQVGCALTAEELRALNQKGQALLRRRIEEDAIRNRIFLYFNDKRGDGLRKPLGKEETDMLKREHFLYAKTVIKDRGTTMGQAWNAVRLCRTLPYGRKASLMLKLLWYKML